MSDEALIPAVQYVRMSTEDQQFSIENQKAVIGDYASRHGFDIVATFEDAGRSGLLVEIRDGLRRLLKDVLSGQAQYRAILVYDISRWGRFQDTDEAAHYEFICKRAGAPIHYCAEPFENDGTMSSSLLKALKRAMAAEYSRELGVKVHAGQTRIVRLGFRVGGQPGLGYRRKMLSLDGRRAVVLKNGQQKFLKTDHVVLVLGPSKEVFWVRKIFKMALEGIPFDEIADYLNERGMRSVNGRRWTYLRIYNIVRNPKYTGCNVWNRTTGRLLTKRTVSKPEERVVKANAFPRIVSQATFDGVQRIIQQRRGPASREQVFRKIQRLLARKGKLTSDIIDRERNMPSSSTVARLCGDGYLAEVYRRLNYKPAPRTLKEIAQNMFAFRLRADLIRELLILFPKRITFLRLPRMQRRTLLIDKEVEVSLLAAKPFRAELGVTKWHITVFQRERNCVTLIYVIDEKFETIKELHLLPKIACAVRKYWRLRSHDPLLSTGQKLKGLSEFCNMVRKMAGKRIGSHDPTDLAPHEPTDYSTERDVMGEILERE